MLQAMGPATEPIYELFLVSFVYFLYQFYELDDRKYLIYSSILMTVMTLTRPISILYPAYFLILTIFITLGGTAVLCLAIGLCIGSIMEKLDLNKRGEVRCMTQKKPKKP